MMLGVRYAMLFLLIGLAATLPAPVQATSMVITVGAGGAYARLADALAVAPSGATIELLPGFHQGQWAIDRPLTLRGRHGLVLDGGGAGTLLTVTAPHVTITGLTLQNGGHSAADALIHVLADDVLVEGNRFDGFQRAIAVTSGAARAAIRNNTLVDQGELPVAQRGDAIYLADAPDAVVELNTLLRVRDGVYVNAAPRSSVRGNQFHTGRYGVYAPATSELHVAHNTFEQVEQAIVALYAPQLTLARNRIVASRAVGVSITESAGFAVEANDFAENPRALHLGAASSGTVRHNRFAANASAVSIDTGAGDLRFVGNDFVDNRRAVAEPPGANTSWQGNYWGRFARAPFDAAPSRQPAAHAGGALPTYGAPSPPFRPTFTLLTLIALSAATALLLRNHRNRT
jgi:nitrous oxidase accessory protein